MKERKKAHLIRTDLHITNWSDQLFDPYKSTGLTYFVTNSQAQTPIKTTALDLLLIKILWPSYTITNYYSCKFVQILKFTIYRQSRMWIHHSNRNCTKRMYPNNIQRVTIQAATLYPHYTTTLSFQPLHFRTSQL